MSLCGNTPARSFKETFVKLKVHNDLALAVSAYSMSNHINSNKEQEFEILFTSYYSRLYYYALSYINDSEICKDIISDVFGALWADYDHVKKETISSYLYACTRNRCVDFLRHQSIKNQYKDFLIANAEHEIISDLKEYDERLERIHRAIETMPPQRQFVLKECYFKGKSYKEVAAFLGITTDGVKRHITMALKSLRNLFSR